MASPEKSLGKRGRGRPKGSTSKKNKKKTPRHMHIERSDNGGFNVRHSYDTPTPDSDEEATPDSTHSLGNADDLLSHVQSTFGGNSPGAAASVAGAGPSALSAGPGAAAAPPQGMQTGG